MLIFFCSRSTSPSCICSSFTATKSDSPQPFGLSMRTPRTSSLGRKVGSNSTAPLIITFRSMAVEAVFSTMGRRLSRFTVMPNKETTVRAPTSNKIGKVIRINSQQIIFFMAAYLFFEVKGVFSCPGSANNRREAALQWQTSLQKESGRYADKN